MITIKKGMLAGAAVAALTLGMTGVSLAQGSVQSQIDRLENELRELKAQMQMRDAKLKDIEAAAGDLAKLPKFDGKKLQITSRDGKYSIRLGGRIHLDASIADTDDLDPSHAIDGGIEFRRVRAFISGKVAGDWKYKFQMSFTDNDGIEYEDVYIGYTGFKPVSLKFGNFKEPFGLEELTSSKYDTFMEEAMANTFAPGRNTGAQISTHGDNWSATVGYFFEGILVDGADNVSSEDNGVTGRVHLAPLADKTQAIHLGLSAFYKSDQDGTERFRARPEIHNSDRLIDTGTITNVEDVTSIQPEIAGVWGPFSAQAEYTFTQIGRTGAPDIDLEGFYIYGSYFVTGQSRPYDAEDGEFGRVKANGAIELALRYSYLDLDDTGITDSERGEESNITAAMNYYWNPYVVSKVNYVYADVDHPTGALPDEEAHIFGTRLQIDF